MALVSRNVTSSDPTADALASDAPEATLLGRTGGEEDHADDLAALEKDYEEVGTESSGGESAGDAAEGDEY